MKVRPMLGNFALKDIDFIESSERRALVEHRVPGLEGSYFQDLGSMPNTIVISGTKHGDEPRDEFLEGIRELFNAGEPTTFVADINTATDITEVVIEDLRVAEVAGSLDSFRYEIKLRKYVEPPAPAATGLLDDGILDDALNLTDALDLIDGLGSIPDLGDPTKPLRQALDGVSSATSGIDQVVSAVHNLFTETETETRPEEAAGEEPAPVEEGLAPETMEEIPIDPADPWIDEGAMSTLQGMMEDPETAETAAGLVRGISGGTLAGIYVSDSDEVLSLADAHGIEPSQLVPSGQDAALVLDPEGPLEAPPTIVLRSDEPDIRDDPDRLAAALEAVSKTFNLFQQQDIGPCDSSPVAIPVPNLVPAMFCQMPATGMLSGIEPETPVVEGPPPAAPRELTYSTDDVIDERISVPAQHSLVRLSKNPETSAAAVGLLEEVKADRLAGIYCVNWEKSAKRAKAFESNWWTVIPEGEDAVLMLDPDELEAGHPLISFRRGLDPGCGLLEGEQQFVASPEKIDAALISAWGTYQLWQRHQLVPCASNPSAVPVSNLVPLTLCRLLEPVYFGGGFLPTVFSSKRNFPKPSAIPVLHEIAKRAAADPTIQILVVGHAEATGSDSVDSEISLARASAVAALLTGEEAFMRFCFSAPPPLNAWDWEEAQFMLSAIPFGDDLFYAGLIDGNPGPMTANAVMRFQTFHNLGVTGELDEPTLDCLVHEYSILIGPTRPAAVQVIVHGGGSWHPPRSFGNDSEPIPPGDVQSEVHPGPHRVDFFLVPGDLDPPLSNCKETKHIDCAAYEAWCKKVREPISFTRNFLMPIRLVEANRGFIANQPVDLFEIINESEEQVAALTTNSAGLIFLQAPVGFYSLHTTIRNELFAIPFWAHADEVGGITIHLPVELIPDNRLKE